MIASFSFLPTIFLFSSINFFLSSINLLLISVGSTAMFPNNLILGLDPFSYLGGRGTWKDSRSPYPIFFLSSSFPRVPFFCIFSLRYCAFNNSSFFFFRLCTRTWFFPAWTRRSEGILFQI